MSGLEFFVSRSVQYIQVMFHGLFHVNLSSFLDQTSTALVFYSLNVDLNVVGKEMEYYMRHFMSE